MSTSRSVVKELVQAVMDTEHDELDELSRKTLRSYSRKAKKSLIGTYSDPDPTRSDVTYRKRVKGLRRAVKRVGLV
jgi:hypothetical protein